MPRTPEPIEVIRAKLHSTDEATRLVALKHAAAHGKAARDLAINVLRLYEDSSQRIPEEAFRTFQKIGGGAGECVPLLLDMMARSGPNRPFNRLALSLGAVGPAAAAALPTLRERYRAHPDNNHVPMAILRIAADDPETISLLLDRAFSHDFSTRMRGSMFIERLSEPFIDMAFDRIRSGAGSADPETRAAAASVLLSLAGIRPDAVMPLVTTFLADPSSSPTVHLALSAAAKLLPPFPPALVGAVIRVMDVRDGRVRMTAMSTFEKVGSGATHAEPVLLRIIRSNMRSVPVSGERGWAASELAAAALALARHCPSKDAVEPLLSWLLAMPKARPEGREWLSYRSAGDVAKALAMLDPTSPAVQSAILAVIASSRSMLDSADAGVIDFERRVREAFALFPNEEELYRKAEALGMARVDPFAHEDRLVEDVSEELPDFPTADEVSTAERAPAAQPPRVSRVHDDLRPVLDDLIRKGGELLALEANPAPANVAAATNAWITRAKYSSTPGQSDATGPVGAAYGEAIRRQLGWEWRVVHHGARMTLAIASPDDAYLHLPVAFISRQLEPTKSPTALLLFNMLAQGQLPPSVAGGLTEIG